jgi:hypothetical protein
MNTDFILSPMNLGHVLETKLTNGRTMEFKIPSNADLSKAHISMDVKGPDGPLKLQFNPDEHVLGNPFIKSARLTDHIGNTLQEFMSKKAREDEMKKHGFILQDEDGNWDFVPGTGTPFFEKDKPKLTKNQKKRLRKKLKKMSI